MRETGLRRVHLGFAVAIVAVAAGLLLSPAATTSVFAAIGDDPTLFGLAVALCYLLRPLFAWPTTPLAVIVGYGFGLTAGVPIAMVGVLVTVIPPFLVARWIADGTTTAEVERLPFGSVVTRAGDVVDRYFDATGPMRGVVISRLAPVPSDIATCAAAVSGVSMARFLAGTAIGELPWTIAAVFVGASAAAMTTDGIGSVGPLVVVACLFGAIVLLSGPLYQVITDADRYRTSH
ncbi:TVP38/TMEM64 family protein [Halovivax gelatinilyticus]|uniref:TVP38/TMEM64 family protein n=1 Tax=Halovivax gelatinilyticus TaxID=2961597 RepID=UPI0020CA84D9|nr:VTT domain-containing protein [Halovivax gelatinilyticus]